MRKLLLTLSIPLFFSCVNDDNPDLAVVETFTVTAAPDYFGTYSEAYIILHDINGTPVDYKPIQDGETIEFQVNKSKKYHVTEYKTKIVSGKSNSFLSSKLLVDLSENLVLGAPTPGDVEYAPNLTGEFMVNVSNSDPIVSLVSARGYASTYPEFATSVSPVMRYFSDVNQYLAVAYSESGHSRYQFIENPEKDKTYELAYEDMSEFEQILKLPVADYASFFYSVTSINPESAKGSPGFIIKPDGWSFSPDDFYEIGYIDAIDNYVTSISGKKNANSKTRFSYQKHGSAPTEIEVIDIDEIKLQKSKITDFEIATTTENVAYTSSFSSPLSYLAGSSFQFLQWTVKSGNSNKFALELPEELKSGNNLIADLDELRINTVTLSKTLEEKGSESDLSFELTVVSQTYEY